ncbi:Hypothetical predicted protein [Olea europaea subsp. europaea]|uniref:Uncharacterized protein n=1 Tax=Olea europaea subsp. europaea TaxID=158383 RepID=A0A8S0Q471_OLEEU|nr:Hypothetical predicted protein [Olea europaea subsp. europaea]
MAVATEQRVQLIAISTERHTASAALGLRRHSAHLFWRLMCAVLEAKAMTEAIHCRRASHLMASNPLSEDNPRKRRSVGKPVVKRCGGSVCSDLGGGGRRDSDEVVILVAVVVCYCYCWWWR